MMLQYTELLFVTYNQHKYNEVKQLMPPSIRLLSLQNVSYISPIDEPYNTLEENSLHKAKTVFIQLKIPCFAEDTGLCVDVLEGAPGVRSARYASENATDDENITKLLYELKNNKQRHASFRTILTFISKDVEIQFEGVLNGEISEHRIGQLGFGYDSVFVPHGYVKTLAQMKTEEKVMLSHRSKAFTKFLDYISE